MRKWLSHFRRSRGSSNESEPAISIAGVVFDDDCRNARAAILTSTGNGINLQWTLRGTLTMATTPEIVLAFRRLRETDLEPSSSVHQTLVLGEWLARQLAGFADASLRRLLQRCSIPAEHIIAMGLMEPGLSGSLEEDPENAVETDEPSRIRFQRNLTNTALLAELTGVPIIDDFAARDLAVGGRGGPLEPLAWWTLFHHELRNRLLLDLHPDVVRYTWLPKPCSLRVDRSLITGTLPRTSELGSTLDRLLREIRSTLPASLPIEEILFDVESELSESYPTIESAITSQFAPISTYPLRLLGIPMSHRPACVASLMARFFLDRIPSNFPTLTGGSAPRILGRLTPGNAAATERLLRFMNAEPLVPRTLRSGG